MKKTYFKRSLVNLAIASTLVMSQQAMAYENDENTKEEIEEVERVVVTGSRIARINTDTPSPVVTLDSQSIEATGILNITDLLTKMPQFAMGNSSSTGNYSFGNAGLNTANLRDLGADRTLTVVNGRRIVQSSTDAGRLVTDTGFIPVDLLERTDILTGGASSTYGSDAVAGVVNFVLKRDFEGTKISGQFGESDEYNDGREKSFTLTTGHNILADKGNIVFTYDYFDQGYASAAKRPNARLRTDWITNPLHNPDAENVDTDGIPAKIIANNVTWPDYNIEGRIMGMWNYDENHIDYYDITNGIPTYLFNTGEVVNSYRMLNPNGFDPAADGKVVSPYERHSFYSVFNYDFDNGMTLTTDLRYTDVNSQNNIASEFSYGSWVNAANFADDAELSDEVRDLINSDGGWAFTPYGLNDLGPRKSRTDRELFAFSSTLEGEFSNGWLWDVYVSAGKTKNDALLSGRTNKYRLPDGGNYTYGPDGICGVADMTCPAWNSLQPMSQEVIDYVRLDPYGQQIESEQYMFSAAVSGDILELPAGDVMFAAGIEARRESIDVSVDETWQDEDLNGSLKLPWDKGRNIYEAFVELDIPVISDVFLIDDLIFNAAARYSDYQYAGDNTTWKVALDWSVIEELTVRSTYSHSVRAPQLVEMYGSTSIGFASGLSDPCDKQNIETLKADLKAQVISNCQAFGVSDPENFESDTNLGNGTDSTTSGNPYLDVEEADTFTFGFVVQPTFIENFALTVDYYDIDLTDAIENISASQILYDCAESTNIESSVYCPLITRAGDGNITNVLVAPVNKGAFTRRGLDIETSYDVTLPVGELALRLNASRIIELSSQSAPGEERYNYRGVYGAPDWKGRFEANYTVSDVRVNWSIDYSDSALVGRDKDGEDYSVPEVPSSVINNVRVAYDVNEDTNVYIGARNLFDKTWTHHPSTSGGSEAGYSLMGRFLYAGFNYTF